MYFITIITIIFITIISITTANKKTSESIITPFSTCIFIAVFIRINMEHKSARNYELK